MEWRGFSASCLNGHTPCHKGTRLNRSRSKGFLHIAGVSTLVIALAGQAVFAAYIALTYGRFLTSGDPDAVITPLQNGYIAGDPVGNALLYLHLGLAFLITVAAGIQFLPVIRRKWPAMHRWNGRVYLITALIISSAAIVLKLSRELHESPAMTAGLVLNGLLIFAFAFPAWWFARKRRFDVHRRWVLRLFIMVSGTWLLRVGMMFWIAATGGIGIDFESMSGPFLGIWAFAHYLIPLALLEAWLRAEKAPGSSFARTVSSFLVLYALTLIAGTIVTTLGMWLPLSRGENIFA